MSDPGRIVTFYSFKGGVGRSMALANVAWILASNGYRVLAIDWDLEAPGLHRYFAPFLLDPSLTSTEGLIEFVEAFADAALTPPVEQRSDEPWYAELADIRQFAISVDFEFPRDGLLHLVPAGRQGPRYGARTNAFEWHTFYERLGGGVFLERAREEMRRHYDYVLIDSRTGVSDTSGVCTLHLPDSVVVLFTANNQSMEGALSVAKRVAQHRPGAPGAGMRVIPVMTRVSLAEHVKLEAARAHASALFDEFVSPAPPGGVQEYWRETETLNVPFYAYEEVLAVFRDAPGSPNTLLQKLEALAYYVSAGRVKRLVPAGHEMRRRTLQAYRRGGGPSWDAVFSYPSAERDVVRHIVKQLERFGVRVWLEENIKPGSDRHTSWGRALESTRAVVVIAGKGRLGPAQRSELDWASRDAAARGLRLIPVLLPEASPDDLPRELTSRQWIRFRSIDDARALEELSVTLGGDRPGRAWDVYISTDSASRRQAERFHTLLSRECGVFLPSKYPQRPLPAADGPLSRARVVLILVSGRSGPSARQILEIESALRLSAEGKQRLVACAIDREAYTCRLPQRLREELIPLFFGDSVEYCARAIASAFRPPGEADRLLHQLRGRLVHGAALAWLLPLPIAGLSLSLFGALLAGVSVLLSEGLLQVTAMGLLVLSSVPLSWFALLAGRQPLRLNLPRLESP